MSRRPLALAATVALVAGLGAALPSATAVPEPDDRTASARPGAAGVGDSYFKYDGNGGYDVAHYRVRNRYDFSSGRLAGRTRITATSTQRLSRLQLDFLLPVKAVRVNGKKARFSRPNKHELRIRPKRPIAAGDRFEVVVRYAGRPGRVRWRGESSWLADRREVVTMGQPHMAAWWFPANDHPSDKARMDIRISVPRGNQVIANGELVKRVRQGKRVLWHWRAKEPMAPYLAFFAAGRFRVDRGTTDGIGWTAAVSKQVPKAARGRMMRQMRRSPGLLRWLETQVGAYPFSSTGGVVTALDVGFALENQTRPTYPVVPGDISWLLVHELAHQWFGNHVALADWSDIWLNEGFATFFEARYFETHGGQPAATWLQRTYAAQDDAFWRVPIGDPGRKRIFHSAVYQRGGMTMQALRQRIGEPAFWTLVRTWVARYGGGNATTADFHALAEEVSGQDLDSFFTAWLHTPAQPAPTAENGLS